jgi:hypothetical protein
MCVRPVTIRLLFACAFATTSAQAHDGDPVARAVVAELDNHLSRVGLADARAATSRVGFDSAGRTWFRDELGYPYYLISDLHGSRRIYYRPHLREVAATARREFESVNFEVAIRRAARNVVVRGFNQIEVPGVDVRDSVREAVIRRLNSTELASGQLGTLQNLVQAGIEDALIEAFNQTDVQQAKLAAGLTTPMDGSERELPIAPQPKRRPKFDKKYDTVKIVASGWIVTAERVLPLHGNTFYITSMGDSEPLVDVWTGDGKIASRCRYAHYFEDAKQIQQQLKTRSR